MLPLTAPHVTAAPPAALCVAARKLLTELVAGRETLAQPMGRSVLARYPQFRAAFAQHADWLGVAPELLAAAALSYDYTVDGFGCSTMALATPTGPLIARNMDWFPEQLIAQASAILPVGTGWSAGIIGSVGVFSGLASNFAVVLNAVSSGQLNQTGFPVLLFLRHLLTTARDFADAVEQARATPLMASALFTLVGTRNEERVVVERTPDRSAVRSATGSEPLITTNHYRAIVAAPAESACGRYCQLGVRAAKLPAQPSHAQLLACLTDAEVIQSITAQHVLMQPTAQMIEMYLPAHLLD